MKSKYKVGDQVLIKSKYDPGKTGCDYKAYFNSDMLSEYGGTIQTIESICYHSIQDYYYFDLKNCSYVWTEDMFDHITDEL